MTTAYTNTASPKDKHHPPMNYSDNSGLPWNPYVMPAQYTPESSALYDFTGLPYTTNNELSYPAFESDPSCPRSYTAGLGLTDPMGNMSMTEAYPPSAYVISPPKSHDDHGMDLPCQNTSPLLSAMNTDCDSKPSHLNLPDSAYDSPYGSVVGTPCSTTLDEVPVMKNEGEENPLDKEQPYAQLIYRALMDAPGHTMILRDIYNWFKTNTDKAADKETKGWQNSIRHNLSMNGVSSSSSSIPIASSIPFTAHSHSLSPVNVTNRSPGLRKSRPTKRRRLQKGLHVETHRRSHPRRRKIHNPLPLKTTQQTKPHIPQSASATSSLRCQRRASK